MKAIVTFVLLFTALVLAGQHSTARTKPGHTSETRLARQIENYVSYPEVLAQLNTAAVVVIRFQLTEDKKIAAVKVFSTDAELNATLQRQLTGKRVFAGQTDLKKTYVARLHFQRS